LRLGEVKMKKVLQNQVSILLFGFGFWLPIIITVFILVFIFNYIEDFGRDILLLFLPARFFYPGFGIVFGILLVYLTGILLKHTKIKKIFSKIPILGLFFGGGEVITIDRLIHMNPCLFLISPSCLSYGWILSEEQVKLRDDKAGFTLINVYYPNVPTLVTGQVYPIRKAAVIKLGNPSKEVIDLLLYALKSPKDLIYLPWEDESIEDFVKRAKSFGLNIPPAT
jgi:hypothetical protein